MKKPRRNKYEQIEDAFFDLEIDEQERMLNTLNSLFRMKCRLAETARGSLDRGQQHKTDAVASAAGVLHVYNCISSVNLRPSLLDDPATDSDDGGSQVIDASTLTQEPGTNKIRIPKP